MIANRQELLSSLFFYYLYHKNVKVQVVEVTICDDSIFVLWVPGVFLMRLYVTVLL